MAVSEYMICEIVGFVRNLYSESVKSELFV